MVRRQFVTVALAGLVLIGASGCSWRLETEPEPYRTPSAVTVLRDHVAAAEAALSAAARGDSGAAADAEGAAVPARLEALGGVSPTSSPRPSTDFASAVELAQTESLECMDAAGDDPLGGLCASIALSHVAIAMVAGGGDVSADPLLAAAGLLPGEDTTVAPHTLSDLAVQHDRLRALYEVVAARATGANRKQALALSTDHGERVTALLAIDGVEDRRDVAYDVPAASVATAEDRNRTIADAEHVLAQDYASLLVSAHPQDREWLLNAALDAYARAAVYGLSVAEVPPLPGAVAPEPSPSAT